MASGDTIPGLVNVQKVKDDALELWSVGLRGSMSNLRTPQPGAAVPCRNSHALRCLMSHLYLLTSFLSFFEGFTPFIPDSLLSLPFVFFFAESRNIISLIAQFVFP